MDISVKDFKELMDQIELLDNESTLRLDINSECLSYSIIVRNARCKFTGNIIMPINGAIEITIQGLNFLHNQITIPVEIAEYYLNLLSSTKDKNIIQSIKILMKEQLKVGDIIEWQNGKIGTIIQPVVSHNGQVYYRLVKKNGDLGAREFVLYGKTKEYNYKCRNREFKDYRAL